MERLHWTELFVAKDTSKRSREGVGLVWQRSIIYMYIYINTIVNSVLSQVPKVLL